MFSCQEPICVSLRQIGYVMNEICQLFVEFYRQLVKVIRLKSKENAIVSCRTDNRPSLRLGFHHDIQGLGVQIIKNTALCRSRISCKAIAFIYADIERKLRVLVSSEFVFPN